MIVALFVQLTLGLVFARLGRDRIRADGPSASPAVLLVLANAAIITAPIALYFYAVQPAWTWHYLVDPAKVPGLAVLPLVVLHAAVVVGGWYLGAALVRAERARELLYATIASAVGAAIAGAVLFPRLVAASSYPRYHAGFAGRLMSVELGWAILVSAAATVAAGGYVMVELARDGRRVRAR